MLSSCDNPARLNRSPLARLSAAEFERVLHPVFEEDEWTLILVGTALGGLAGAGQAAIGVRWRHKSWAVKESLAWLGRCVEIRGGARPGSILYDAWLGRKWVGT